MISTKKLGNGRAGERKVVNVLNFSSYKRKFINTTSPWHWLGKTSSYIYTLKKQTKTLKAAIVGFLKYDLYILIYQKQSEQIKYSPDS